MNIIIVKNSLIKLELWYPHPAILLVLLLYHIYYHFNVSIKVSLNVSPLTCRTRNIFMYNVSWLWTYLSNVLQFNSIINNHSAHLLWKSITRHLGQTNTFMRVNYCSQVNIEWSLDYEENTSNFKVITNHLKCQSFHHKTFIQGIFYWFFRKF